MKKLEIDIFVEISLFNAKGASFLAFVGDMHCEVLFF
jgi:hypothetical protein